MASEDYESAERLCIDNYHDDKNNPYYIQPYFESLIHKYITIVNSPEDLCESNTNALTKSENICVLMCEMLETMNNIDLPQAKQMYVSMLVEYYASVENSLDKAMIALNEGIAQVKDTPIYLYLTKYDIAYRFKDISIMKDTLDSIEHIVSNQKYFSNALNLRRARFYAAINDRKNAVATLDKVRNMPSHAMEKFREEMNMC